MITSITAAWAGGWLAGKGLRAGVSPSSRADIVNTAAITLLVLAPIVLMLSQLTKPLGPRILVAVGAGALSIVGSTFLFWQGGLGENCLACGIVLFFSVPLFAPMYSLIHAVLQLSTYGVFKLAQRFRSRTV